MYSVQLALDFIDFHRFSTSGPYCVYSKPQHTHITNRKEEYKSDSCFDKKPIVFLSLVLIVCNANHIMHTLLLERNSMKPRYSGSSHASNLSIKVRRGLFDEA